MNNFNVGSVPVIVTHCIILTLYIASPIPSPTWIIGVIWVLGHDLPRASPELAWPLQSGSPPQASGDMPHAEPCCAAEVGDRGDSPKIMWKAKNVFSNMLNLLV